MPEQAMKCNRSTVWIDGEFLIINAGQMWDYDIPLRDLRTNAGLDQWIDHLSEKSWVTPSILSAVRRLVAGL